jgi:hypothetical protein
MMEVWCVSLKEVTKPVRLHERSTWPERDCCRTSYLLESLPAKVESDLLLQDNTPISRADTFLNRAEDISLLGEDYPVS